MGSEDLHPNRRAVIRHCAVLLFVNPHSPMTHFATKMRHRRGEGRAVWVCLGERGTGERERERDGGGEKKRGADRQKVRGVKNGGGDTDTRRQTETEEHRESHADIQTDRGRVSSWTVSYTHLTLPTRSLV